MSIVEFLLARRTEATENAIIAQAAWDAVSVGMTPSEAMSWLRKYDKTLAAQSARLDCALGNLGWAYLSIFWPARVRREAARYADHPDYRDEWRP